MFSEGDLFYFATIRKITASFGSLFNHIYIQRFEFPGGQGEVLKTIRVPLSYANGEKWYVHSKQDISAQTYAKPRISLPRIGFSLVGLQYNPSRKLQTMKHVSKPETGNVESFLKQLNPVPYDLTYEVYIAVKNIDDGLQIIEQIIPNFTPSFNLTVKDIPELNIVKDIPVELVSVNFVDNFEGDFLENRIIEWTLTFTVRAYVYPVIRDNGIIREVIASLYKDKELQHKNEVITVKVDPIDAEFTEDWTAKTDIFREEDLDSNGNPIEP